MLHLLLDKFLNDPEPDSLWNCPQFSWFDAWNFRFLLMINSKRLLFTPFINETSAFERMNLINSTFCAFQMLNWILKLIVSTDAISIMFHQCVQSSLYLYSFFSSSPSIFFINFIISCLFSTCLPFKRFLYQFVKVFQMNWESTKNSYIDSDEPEKERKYFKLWTLNLVKYDNIKK